MEKVYSMKHEELPVVGGFVLESFKLDQAEFIKYSPVYADNFLPSLQTQLTEINSVVKPVVITAKMKTETDKLHAAEDSLLQHLSHLEGYANKAAQRNTIKVADLKLSLLRKKCRSRDAEGVLEGIKTLKQVMAPFLAVFTELGYTAEKQAGLDALFNTIEEANKQQNLLYNQRIQLVNNNIGLLNDFWRKIQEILNDGKILFAKNPVKKKEYTLTEIMPRVRAAVKKENPGS